MKKHLLFSLLLMLLIPSGFGLPSQVSKPAPEVMFSGDSSKFVLENQPPQDWKTLLTGLNPEEATAVGEVIDEDLGRAFSEGYKQGTLDWKPDVVALKTDDRLEKAQVWWNGFWVGSVTSSVATIGLIAGAVWVLGAVSR